MKRTAAVTLSTLSVLLTLGVIGMLLVTFLNALQAYGSLSAIPGDEVFTMLLYALGALGAAAAMLIITIAANGPRKRSASSKPLPFSAPQPPPEPAPYQEEFRFPIGFEQRLEDELQYCREQDQDLALLLISVDGELDTYRDQLTEHFGPSSYIFSLEDHRYAVILPFYDYATAYRETDTCFNSMDHDQSVGRCYGGLTSRGDRDVDYRTLVYEAEVSMDQASRANGSSVYCFKADPEKYSEVQSL